jgi:hypothetical protein
LAQSPEDAVAFLEAQRAERAGRANAARLTRLIAALDDDALAHREKAMKDLLEVADLAAPTLRERLKDKALSPEAHQDIQQVLQEMEVGKAAPQLQWLRATDVLERVDTPGAWRLLIKLGAASGPAGEEAKATLERLDQQVPADRPITVTTPEIGGGP